MSRRRLQRGRRRYGIITVETIDSVVQTRRSRRAHLFKEACAQGGAWAGMRSRRCARRRACGGLPDQASLPSRTRTEEGVYASRLYPTYPDKPGSTIVTRTCQLDGKHAIASGARLRLLHLSSAVTEEAQSKNGVIARLRISAGVLLFKKNQNYPGSESRARMLVLVQVGPDPAYFQTQYTKHPMQLRSSGPSWTREVESCRHGTSRTGTESERRTRSDFPFCNSTMLSTTGGPEPCSAGPGLRPLQHVPTRYRNSSTRAQPPAAVPVGVRLPRQVGRCSWLARLAPWSPNRSTRVCFVVAPW